MNDLQLSQKVKSIIDIYINDQINGSKLHEIQDIPSEIHGHLADLLFIDKVENELFVNFILSMLIHKVRTDEEIMSILKDLQGALSSVIRGIMQYENDIDK